VGDDWDQDETRRAKAALIDTSVPNAARFWDVLAGGQDNFEVDRRAVQAAARVAPVIWAIAPAVRAFHQRAIEYLITEAGVQQFIDIGIGFSSSGNTQEIAQSITPECRTVYVDNDPMVLSHARALRRSSPGGAVSYLDADIRDVSAIVSGARQTLDFSQPVGVLLISSLAFVSDTTEATAIVSSLVQAMPAGSQVATCDMASDLDPTFTAALLHTHWNSRYSPALTARDRAEYAALVAGLDLVPPGVVPVTQWRPAATDPHWDGIVPVRGVVAKKPS
jgi:hypothetical protein